MGEGVDPHDYVATAGDVEKIKSSWLSSLWWITLEGKMGDVFAGLKDKPVLDLGAQLDPSKLAKKKKEFTIHTYGLILISGQFKLQQLLTNYLN